MLVGGKVHGMKAVDIAALNGTENAIAQPGAVPLHLGKEITYARALGVSVGGAGRFYNS